MKSPRTAIVFFFLNLANTKLFHLPLAKQRARFETTFKTIKLPKMKQVADDTVDSVNIRLYKPYTSTAGTIIYFHGGGFSLGSISSHDQMARMLAKYTRQSVISVEYSLAPRARFPTQVNEGLAVINALPELSKKYAFSTKRVSLFGDSAGGFIALHTAQKCTMELSNLMLIYPCITPQSTDLKSMKAYEKNHFITKQNMQRFWRDFLKTEDLPSYTSTWLEKLPPTLIVTAQYDILHSEAHMFHNKLRNAGVSSTFITYRDMWHGFLHTPWPVGKRRKAFRRIARFLNTY